MHDSNFDQIGMLEVKFVEATDDFGHASAVLSEVVRERLSEVDGGGTYPVFREVFAFGGTAAATAHIKGYGGLRLLKGGQLSACTFPAISQEHPSFAHTELISFVIIFEMSFQSETELQNLLRQPKVSLFSRKRLDQGKLPWEETQQRPFSGSRTVSVRSLRSRGRLNLSSGFDLRKRRRTNWPRKPGILETSQVLRDENLR